MTAAEANTKQHFKLYEAFRDYVKHEDDLINNRLNWNFTIQGFLFAAYSFCLEKIADIRLGLLSTYIDRQRVGQMKILHTLFDLHILLAALALTGMSVSFFVYLSVKAARIAIHELESRWFELNPTCAPREEFQGFPWLKALMKGQDRSFKTHETEPPYLPGMIGGGHPAAHWLGFHAPGGLPLAIIAVWLFLFMDALLDLW